MVSVQERKLPYLFAVMDPAPSLPSRYYVFMTYEDINPSVLRVDNMRFSKPFTVWISHAEDTLPHKTKISYTGVETEAIFWNTGIDIMSDENELVPVLDFKTQLFLPSVTNRPAPVYVTPDSITSKSQHQILFRDRRNQMTDILLEMTHAQIRMSPPPPPAIRRVNPAIESFPAGEPGFTLPPHAAATFVRALIQENKTCCITTNSFDEIAVVGITPCFHCFDCEALETWLFAHKTCPECRSTVTSIAKYKR